jgi:NADPH-dependent ferric siderophore reductase
MRRRTVPANPKLYRGEVVGTRLLSPSLQRVTVRGPELAAFPWQGYDHWFRLFVLQPHQDTLSLPALEGDTWWKTYLAVPEADRPHCANYTVADFRASTGELDIDFVLHRSATGELEGAAAIWATGARAGEPMAVFDQGIMFDPPADASDVLIVADETGLPGVAGILRSLPEDAVGRVIQEIPTALDVRDLERPAGVEVSWIVRGSDATVPGEKALAVLREHAHVPPRAYGFVVGESTLATEGRRHLHRMGLAKNRITFSGFWRR